MECTWQNFYYHSLRTSESGLWCSLPTVHNTLIAKNADKGQPVQIKRGKVCVKEEGNGCA